MNTHYPTPAIEQFVCRLLEAENPGRADELILDAQEELAPTRAAALWRPLAPRAGLPLAWYPVRSRGDVELLPASSAVEALLAGSLSEDFLGTGRILSAGTGPAALALVRAEDLDDPEVQGILQALLEVRSAVGDEASEPPGPRGRIR